MIGKMVSSTFFLWCCQFRWLVLLSDLIESYIHQIELQREINVFSSNLFIYFFLEFFFYIKRFMSIVELRAKSVDMLMWDAEDVAIAFVILSAFFFGRVLLVAPLINKPVCIWGNKHNTQKNQLDERKKKNNNSQTRSERETNNHTHTHKIYVIIGEFRVDESKSILELSLCAALKCDGD